MPPSCSAHTFRLGTVSALIWRISTLSFLNSSRFARNPWTWFFHPPVKAKGRNETIVGRPRKLESETGAPLCEASEKSGASVPGCNAMKSSFCREYGEAVAEEYDKPERRQSRCRALD